MIVLDQRSPDYPVFIAELVQELRPQSLVAVTGAGLSASAGIRTFRGDEGVFSSTVFGSELTNYISVASAVRNPEQNPAFLGEYYSEYGQLLLKSLTAQPTVAHNMLNVLATNGVLIQEITSNIDGLGAKPNLVEMHGCVRTMVCGHHPPYTPTVEDAQNMAMGRYSWCQLPRMQLGDREPRTLKPHLRTFNFLYYNDPKQEDYAVLTRSTVKELTKRRIPVLMVIGTSLSKLTNGQQSTSVSNVVDSLSKKADLSICINPTPPTGKQFTHAVVESADTFFFDLFKYIRGKA